ncbi:MAG: SAM-dependent methyltransferase, partial [Streptosporangiaceae bacterium]
MTCIDIYYSGKDNFKVDRDAAEEMIRAFPGIVAGVRMNRAFLGRAIHYLAADAGIRQFLDAGTGLPSSNNTHEVAQRAAPDSRIVYVDNDPIVLSHATALLTSTPEGACAYMDADIRNAGQILKEAAGTLDFSRPVAVCLIMVLQFIPDAFEAGPDRPPPRPGSRLTQARKGRLPVLVRVLPRMAQNTSADRCLSLQLAA